MKLKKPDIRIESAGIESTTRFTIEATSQSFGVLSSTIYEDKIKAPIRELSTNAYDAHVEANCADRPFEVHLPNALDPEFRVRDYGISMSHDQIMTLYTTYFASNKRESNELNGCLGLGSKSPFAYTNQFWVTAYQDGKKRHYVATVDVDGPRFDQYPACETDEENGLEIGFTVKEDDFNSFKNKAESVYKYFKTQPNVTGVDFQHAEPEKYKVAGSCWRYVGSYDDSMAIMGNIGYPIDDEYFYSKDESYWKRSNNKYCQLLKSGVHIDFEIGELSMTASREGLEYTDEVVQVIKDKIDLIYKEMQDNVDKEFESCESLYDARLKACKYENVFRSLDSFVFPKWKNEDGEEISVRTSFAIRTESKVSAADFDCHSFQYANRVKMSRGKYTIHFGDTKKIFLNDMVRGGQAATRYYVQNNSDDTVYLIDHISEEDWSTLCEEIGIDENLVTHTSELEKPPRETKRGSSGPRRIDVDCFIFDSNGTSYNHTSLYDGRWWTPSTKDLKDGENIYVELNRYCACDYDGVSESHPRSLRRVISNLEKLGVDVPVVFGFPSGKAARVRKAKNWVHLYDWANQKLQEYIDTNDVSTIMNNDSILNKMEMGEHLIRLRKMSTVPVLDGYFKKVTDALIKIKGEHQAGRETTAELLKDISSFLGFELPNSTAGSWVNREKRLVERYSILQIYSEHKGFYNLDKEEASLIVKCINDNEVAKVAKNLV